MQTNTFARYRPAMLAAAGVIALWGVLSIFDVQHRPYSGYQTDGNNTLTNVAEGGPADEAGLQAGDYLRSVGGVAVEDAEARARRERPHPGETRVYVVERGDETVRTEVTYAGLPTQQRALSYAGIVVGFCFLVFGLWPYLRAQRARTTLLALFGLGLGSSFFSGPYLASYALRTSAGIVITLLVLMGFATLLHFTLLFPKRKAVLARRHTRDLLYGPAALVFLFLLYRGVFLPPATSTLNVITNVLIGAFILGYFGLALASFVHSYMKASPQERRAQGLSYVLVGVLMGFLPSLVVVLVAVVAPQVVLPGANFFFLTLVLIPISLALAVMRSQGGEASESLTNEVPHHVSLPA